MCKCLPLSAKCLYGSSVPDTSKGSIQVYYGNLTPQIRAVKIFSLLSSVTGLATQPVLVHQVQNLGTPTVVALFGVVGFFTFVTPFLLHMITKKYITYIYFDSGAGNYSAIYLTFFLREKKVIS
jgi:transmembrane protein 70